MVDISRLRRYAELVKDHPAPQCEISYDSLLELIDQLEAAQKDAARYQWLFGARTEAEADSYSGTVGNPLPQDFVLSEIQCFYATKDQVDASIDAAMASKS